MSKAVGQLYEINIIDLFLKLNQHYGFKHDEIMKMSWRTFLAYIESINRNNQKQVQQEKSAAWKQDARRKLGLNG